MLRRAIQVAVVVMAGLLCANNSWATTYYVDFSTGIDTNNGTSKGTPWKHAPGMNGCSGTCASTIPQPGAQFLLKGGVTWDRTAFPMTVVWSGTAANPIYFGVDQSWYAGGSWTRPIFDAGGSQPISGKNVFVDFSSGGRSYVTLDNIEMKRLYWSGTPTFGACEYIETFNATYITLDHLYIHGWVHSASATDDCYIILGQTTAPFSLGTVLQNSVVDGTDSTNGGDAMTVGHAVPNFKNNVMHDLPNFMLPMGHGEVSGNTVYNCKLSFDSSNHENMLETLGADAGGGTFYIFNNVFHDTVAGCEAAFLGNPGETDYVWNNIWYNLGGNPPELVENVAAGVAAYFWNNTIVPAPAGYCLRRGHSATTGTVAFQNNHCISTAATAVDPAILATTFIINHNILQTPTAASNQGYVSSQTYAYSPMNATGSTIGAGTNLSSNCTGLLTSLCTDAGYGQSFNASIQAITGAGRSSTGRPNSSAWDAGAFHFSPVPGNSGAITISNASSTGFTLNWTKATDSVSTQSALLYEVLVSTTNNIFNITNAEANGTVIQPYTADIATFNATGLASGTTYFFNVIVKNEAGRKSAYVMNTGTTSGLLVSPATLQAGAVGIPYAQSITSAGVGPWTFSILTGALPAGLTLNTLTGVLSGTPGSPGTANFTVRVVDSLANQGQRPYSLGIAGDNSTNIVLVVNSVSYNSAPTPGFVGTYTINAFIRNLGPGLSNPIFFKVTELEKLVPDLNPAQPDKLLTADNGAGLAGDVQSLFVTELASGDATNFTFQIGLGSRQQFTLVADLFGLSTGSPISAAEEAGKIKAGAVSQAGARFLNRFTFQMPDQAPESVSPFVSEESASGVMPLASNVAAITQSGSRSRSAVAIDPVLPRRMAVAANDARGDIIVSTTEDGGSTWHATSMSRSLGDLNFFNAQDPSLAFDSLGRLSVVYVLSNMYNAANATVITESTDGVNFNPPFAISFHSAEENVVDSRPVIAISSGGRYVAWENFGSAINVVRSEPGGIFGPPVVVVRGAEVSSPTIAIGRSAVYIGWDEWGFNSRPPYITGGRLMMASSPHGPQLRFSDPLQIATTDIGFSSPRIPMLPGPLGVSTNLNLAVDPRRQNLLYGAFVDKQNGLSIRFARSSDDGRTWTVTTLNNCAGGGDQFGPAMNLDSDGNVYISFYDTLKKQANTAQLFLARSSTAYSFARQQASNGCVSKSDPAQFVFNSPGQSVFNDRTPAANWFKIPNASLFTYQQITTMPIDESRTNLGSEIVTNLGDRCAIAVGAENVLIAWTDTRQGKEDIYLSILSARP